MFKGTKLFSPGSRHSERSSLPAEAEDTAPDTTSPDSGIHVESVLEDSDLDEDATSKGTTYSFSDTDHYGTRMFLGPNRCKVILASKTSDNRQVVCSNIFGACTRKKHSVICQDPTRVAPTGYYLLTPNSKGGADGILETFVSEEEQQEERHNRREQDRETSRTLFSPTGVPLVQETEPTIAHQGPPAEFSAIPPESFLMEETKKPPVIATKGNLKPAPIYSATAKGNPKPAPPLGPPPKKPAPIPSKGSSGGTTPKTSIALTKEDLQEILNSNNQAAAALYQEQALIMRAMIEDFSRCSDAIKSLQDKQALPVSKFFAVRQGALTTVGQGTDQLQKILTENPGASHQVFDTEKEAHQWLANPSGSLAINNQGLSTAPSIRGPTYALNSKPSAQHQPTTTKRAFVDPTLGALMHIRGNGPDKSTGTANEIFGVKLMDRRVTEAMCPVGISAEGASECMHAMPDVAALPGKSGVTIDPTSIGIDNLGQSLLEYLPIGQRPRNVRDTQWKSTTRNTLSSIKSEDDLTETIQQFHEVRDLIMGNYKRALTSTLDFYGYTDEQSEMYFKLGALPSVVRSSMHYYEALLFRLRVLSLQCEGGWDQWKVHLEHHAKKLLLIRLHGTARSDVLLQTYCYLRDGNKSGFMSDKLQAKINKAMNEQIAKLNVEPLGGAAAQTKTANNYLCSHCHSNLHNGGKPKCLFKDKTMGVARELAKEAEKLLRSNPEKCLKDILKEME